MRSIHSIAKLHLRKTICFEEVCDNAKNTTYFHSNNSLIYTPQFHATYGSIMPGRYFSSGTGYRYGFNGKEKDNEVKGVGNQVDFGARIYDSRLGRWMSVDPMFQYFPSYSPYNSCNNNPIYYIDEDGNFTTGDKEILKSQKNFLKILKEWQIAANEYLTNKNKNINPSNLLNIIDEDFRAIDQKINKVGDNNKFSYNQHLGKYVSLGGFPLDVAHFFKCANLANDYPDAIVKYKAEEEEYKQAQSTDPNGFSSAFAPEDMLSNYFGIYFGDAIKSSDNFYNELDAFFKEISDLFTNNEVKDAKYLTEDKIKELRKMILEYYDTDDFRDFTFDKKIYNNSNIEKINNNAKNKKLPLIQNGGKDIQAEAPAKRKKTK